MRVKSYLLYNPSYSIFLSFTFSFCDLCKNRFEDFLSKFCYFLRRSCYSRYFHLIIFSFFFFYQNQMNLYRVRSDLMRKGIDLITEGSGWGQRSTKLSPKTGDKTLVFGKDRFYHKRSPSFNVLREPRGIERLP